MIVKKFQGETEKDAILKAQEELGNNAVVLNVKTIKQRGILKLFKKDVVEVTAALEEEELSKKANTGAKEFGKAFEASSYAGNMHKQPDISSRPAGGLNLLADEKISVSSESAVIEQKLDSLHSFFPGNAFSCNVITLFFIINLHAVLSGCTCINLAL